MVQSGNNTIVSGFDDEKDDGLTIILEHGDSDGEWLKVHLNKRLDNYNAGFFQRAVEKILLAGYRRLEFCCSGLGYVSSTGIGAFTNILKDLHLKGGDMVLSQVQPRVHEVFEILGFTTFFTFNVAGSPVGRSAGPARTDATSPFGKPTFPLAFRCPHCAARLRTAKPGKFICSVCKTRIVVEPTGRAQALQRHSVSK